MNISKIFIGILLAISAVSPVIAGTTGLHCASKLDGRNFVLATLNRTVLMCAYDEGLQKTHGSSFYPVQIGNNWKKFRDMPSEYRCGQFNHKKAEDCLVDTQ